MKAALTILAIFEEFEAHSFSQNDGSWVRIGFAHEDANVAVLQVGNHRGDEIEVYLDMSQLRAMSVETGHLAHGR